MYSRMPVVGRPGAGKSVAVPDSIAAMPGSRYLPPYGPKLMREAGCQAEDPPDRGPGRDRALETGVRPPPGRGRARAASDLVLVLVSLNSLVSPSIAIEQLHARIVRRIYG